MNTVTEHRASSGSPPAGSRHADVLVVFGMTGDLAKVMTFNSLYRLERRGLLSVPVVGVAADEWIQCIATIRTLCIDAIHAANSG